MPSLSNHKRIDDLVEKAGISLAHGANFECERMGVKALSMARQQRDFERMIRVTELLQESRLQRLQSALSCGTVTIFDAPITDSIQVHSGCYLVQPPQVGADARRLRLAAFQQEAPVAVLCREPITSINLCPVVAICPGTTIRTKIEPPKIPGRPSIKWFTAALEALGDWAIESIDPGLDLLRRIDALIERLDALPEHANLHEALVTLCREAIEQQPEDDSRSTTRGVIQ